MPTEFTLNPQTISVTENILTLATTFETGHVQTRNRFQRPRRQYTLGWPVAGLTIYDYIQGFFRQKLGAASSFSWETRDPVSPPIDAPTTSEVSGGAKSSRNYDVAITYVTANGETTGSPLVVNAAVQANYLLTVTAPNFWPGVTSVRVYVNDTGNTVYRQTTEITTSGGTWTEPTGALATGTALPSSNTATEDLTVHLLGSSISPSRVSPVIWDITLTFEELFV